MTVFLLGLVQAGKYRLKNYSVDEYTLQNVGDLGKFSTSSQVASLAHACLAFLFNLFVGETIKLRPSQLRPHPSCVRRNMW